MLPSSCGEEPLVVIQPEPQQECFGWGDLLPATTSAVTFPMDLSAPQQQPFLQQQPIVASSPWHLVEEMDSSNEFESSSSDEDDESEHDEDAVMMDSSSASAAPAPLSTFESLTRQNQARRSLRFGPVQVREYALTVGDHPLTADAWPLSLDWQHTASQQYHLDDYEDHYRRTTSCYLRGARNARRQPQRLSAADRRLRLARVNGELLVRPALAWQTQQPQSPPVYSVGC